MFRRVVVNPALDDAIHTDIAARRGLLRASIRAAHLAVYRYPTELAGGFAPATMGRTYRLNSSHVRAPETLSYRHRGVCIEGAVSYEHVRDMGLAPETGVRTGISSSFAKPTRFSIAGNGTRAIRKQAVKRCRSRKPANTRSSSREIKRRGLLYHKRALPDQNCSGSRSGGRRRAARRPRWRSIWRKCAANDFWKGGPTPISLF